MLAHILCCPSALEVLEVYTNHCNISNNTYSKRFLGIVVRITDTPERNFSEEASVLVSLLKEMKHDQLAGDLFVDLLSEFLATAPNSNNCISFHFAI